MLAVDTNVLVRFLARDDAGQTARVDNLFRRNRIWIPKTVLLETEWVLRATYSFDKNRILSDFRGLLGLSTAQAEDAAAVAKALEWYSAGMDFADALHLASSNYASAFATFDRGLAQRATQVKALPVVAP